MFEIIVKIISFSFFFFLLGITIFTFASMVLFILLNKLLLWIKKLKKPLKN